MSSEAGANTSLVQLSLFSLTFSAFPFTHSSSQQHILNWSRCLFRLVVAGPCLFIVCHWGRHPDITPGTGCNMTLPAALGPCDDVPGACGCTWLSVHTCRRAVRAPPHRRAWLKASTIWTWSICAVHVVIGVRCLQRRCAHKVSSRCSSRTWSCISLAMARRRRRLVGGGKRFPNTPWPRSGEWQRPRRRPAMSLTQRRPVAIWRSACMIL